MLMAHAGCASRRKCADLIKDGLVRVNGKVVREPGYRIDLAKDRVVYQGRELSLQEEKRYIILNKPKGVVTTAEDVYNRQTVFNLIPKNCCRLYHVGRLDKDSTGLLLITNDGDLAYRLTHPKFEVERVYEVVVKGRLKDEDVSRLQSGIYLKGRRTSPCKIRILARGATKTMVKISLHEGRKRQIRNMFEKIGHHVIVLKRISFGPIKLGGLKTGAYRFLSRDEIEKVYRLVF